MFGRWPQVRDNGLRFDRDIQGKIIVKQLVDLFAKEETAIYHHYSLICIGYQWGIGLSVKFF